MQALCVVIGGDEGRSGGLLIAPCPRPCVPQCVPGTAAACTAMTLYLVWSTNMWIETLFHCHYLNMSQPTEGRSCCGAAAAGKATWGDTLMPDVSNV